MRSCVAWFKELNPRWRVSVKISKPSRVELKSIDVILATPESFDISTENVQKWQ
jgi:hypothetical protein